MYRLISQGETMKKFALLSITFSIATFTASFSAQAAGSDYGPGCCVTLSAGATSTSSAMLGCAANRDKSACSRDAVNKCGWKEVCDVLPKPEPKPKTRG